MNGPKSNPKPIFGLRCQTWESLNVVDPNISPVSRRTVTILNMLGLKGCFFFFVPQVSLRT